jgi:RNA polymerase sigma-70 factor (ECF subfamily)
MMDAVREMIVRGPDPGTSATLLVRLRHGEPEAWRRLDHLYGPLVRYWCGRWGLSRDDADDVVQEVFAALTAGLAGFRRDRPGDTFRGWLRGVTRNHVLMHLRRAGRQPLGAGGTDALRRIGEVPDGPADEPDDAPGEVSALYRRALDLVRGEFEAATWGMFWRHVIDGRPTGAVATEFGVSAAAVRKAKSRVLRRLKEEVGDLAE